LRNRNKDDATSSRGTRVQVDAIFFFIIYMLKLKVRLCKYSTVQCVSYHIRYTYILRIVRIIWCFSAYSTHYDWPSPLLCSPLGSSRSPNQSGLKQNGSKAKAHKQQTRSLICTLHRSNLSHYSTVQEIEDRRNRINQSNRDSRSGNEESNQSQWSINLQSEKQTFLFFPMKIQKQEGDNIDLFFSTLPSQ
jgi:hypothetical protein